MTIDRLWPEAAADLSDEALVAELRGVDPVLRVNFVTSVDGAATRDGLSGGLGDAADRRYFELLRRVADVVVVGAGTVRAEGYGPLRVSEASVAWRTANGLTPHPVFAIVSGSLDLDPGDRIFADAPTRPVVVTTAGHSVERFTDVADVIEAGSGDRIDPDAAVVALHSRGLTRILCEGGPSLFGALLAADLVDELCVTVAPTLEAGDARRISAGELPEPRSMRLAHVLRSGSTLLLRYGRGG
ncbi:pyrimidine reductase family protein [Protaetiibacter mangrovi]|uniref:Pyrimidine reductase family protein n=1 Tax=Protaetiibacter mangrovi TaxID=2970926 RepID=A0ABT1ZDP4_9MICO|nr:pyrimidine reductase family protein [Protaetiibacter mangrovi]MCS0498821.1 pyrimidine reductase family protein [Protaetiibacter mangrovi]